MPHPSMYNPPMPSRYNPDLHHRRSIRLPGYDYTLGGAYFLTLCTYQRKALFGEIVNGVMNLINYGQVIHDEWLRTSSIRPEIRLDAFIVMPNHLHAIVLFSPAAIRGRQGTVGAHGRAPLRRSPRSLGSLVAGFKASSTKQINLLRDNPGVSVWQRNYYEHVIRDEAELSRIREYVVSNPSQWPSDELNPSHKPHPRNRGGEACPRPHTYVRPPERSPA